MMAKGWWWVNKVGELEDKLELMFIIKHTNHIIKHSIRSVCSYGTSKSLFTCSGIRRCGGRMRLRCKGIFKQKSILRVVVTDLASRICWPCPRRIRGCLKSRRKVLWTLSTLTHSPLPIPSQILQQFDIWNYLTLANLPANPWPRLSKVLSSDGGVSLALSMYVAKQITSLSLSLTPSLYSHYSLFPPTFFRIRMRAPEGKSQGTDTVVVKSNTFF